jgi:hypothetical protein
VKGVMANPDPLTKPAEVFYHGSDKGFTDRDYKPSRLRVFPTVNPSECIYRIIKKGVKTSRVLFMSIHPCLGTATPD